MKNNETTALYLSIYCTVLPCKISQSIVEKGQPQEQLAVDCWDTIVGQNSSDVAKAKILGFPN
jgi:hypothetical protein